MSGFTEDDVVAAFRRIGGGAPGVKVGIGDDAAVVDPVSGDLVLAADMLVDGVHFDRERIAPRDLGAKAVIVNVSDMAAMAASPRYALAAVGLPAGTALAWAVELFGGMRAACDEYALSLVGGDLSRSPAVTISVSVTGTVAPGRAVLRSGARSGQRIVVTGSLGAAAGGLMLSRAGGRVLSSAAADGWGHSLLEALDRPVARVGEAELLRARGATAMIDCSDGLAKDLGRICAESGVGARVSLADVPVAVELELLAERTGDDPQALALSGGEDYELIATMDAGAVAGATEDLRERFGVALTAVGEIVEDPGLVAVAGDGTERALEPAGWDHFAS